MSSTPRVFISYSWSSEEYGARVVDLASHLQADGIVVVLDRWDLREGQDKHAYMERAVNDDSIIRVLVLCDPVYAQKANDRQGGVGTETLIISPEVYRHADQQKFLPVIMERDAGGEVVVPTFLEGRIYIDLSDPRKEAAEYQRLVRNIYDKPDLERPPLGTRPRYLDDATVQLRTGVALRSYQDAVLRDQRHQEGLFADYLDKLTEAYEASVLPEIENAGDLDEAVVGSIDAFRPYRDEYVEMLDFVLRYAPKEKLFDQLHGFFEWLCSFRLSQNEKRFQVSLETENLAYIAWELFLYTVATTLKAKEHHLTEQLLQPYLVESRQSYGGAIRGFAVLDTGFRLIDEYRNNRLQRRLYCASATMLQENCHPSISFSYLIEADVVLWFRAAANEGMTRDSWYPRTLVYGERAGYLPSFARSQSRRFFESFGRLLGVDSPEKFREIFDHMPESQFYQVGQFWGRRNSYEHLIQSANIGTKP